MNKLREKFSKFHNNALQFKEAIQLIFDPEIKDQSIKAYRKTGYRMTFIEWLELLEEKRKAEQQRTNAVTHLLHQQMMNES